MVQSDFRPRHRGRGAGFTLVELLVVTGIIALLIAILMPALTRARQQARTVQCLSNVRQINIAIQIYMSSHQGKFIPYYNNPGAGEPQVLWMWHLKAYGMNDPVRYCPETREENLGSAQQVGSYTWGSAFQYWGRDWTFGQPPYRGHVATQGIPPLSQGLGSRTHGGSYGLNVWLHRLGVATPTSDDSIIRIAGGSGVNDTATRRLFWSTPVSRHSAEIPVFADAIWVDGAPRETHQPPLTILDPARNGLGTTSHLGRFCIPRHGRSVNVAFLDGHARRVELGDLWTLRWHSQWSRIEPMTNIPFPN